MSQKTSISNLQYKTIKKVHPYSPLQDIWNKLRISNFLKTLPFSSTKLFDTMMVSRALLWELTATDRVVAWTRITLVWRTDYTNTHTNPTQVKWKLSVKGNETSMNLSMPTLAPTKSTLINSHCVLVHWESETTQELLKYNTWHNVCSYFSFSIELNITTSSRIHT